MAPDEPTDAALLAATARDPEAFGLFYRRHVRAVLAYLLSRTRRPELAADLCAEVFATALEDADRYDPRRAPARAWLLAMAGSRLVDSVRRGQVEDRARTRLGMPPRALTDRDLERIEELVDLSRGLSADALVADLPPEQRDAVLARIVHERDYGDIAADLQVSEAVVRQRVSRGLSGLRTRMEADSQ
ncbi:MAG TPA: sigma-70 family RNA polymerase sigma factor [Baekduia sp.]|uniref:RNA polymerase sigma factor n=1 Tax=Baekduia sp. TaxID=2600305 RepID=UPI002C76D1F0|nr:sigma-70 family RNA polymerase sigma factor [Baekduia sp.]HMJ33798.1 sigma-70 family RNA polymerase sigma factor [Baekduia sp.]